MTWGQLGELVAAARQAPALSRGRVTQPVARGSLGPGLWSTDTTGASIAAVTRDEALRIPSVHRGVDLIASTIGSFPLRSYRGRDEQPSTFLAQPEASFPASFTIGQTVRDLIFDGVAYWLVKDRDADGYPALVERVAPWEVSADLGGTVLAAGRSAAASDLIVFVGPDTDWTATGGLLARGLCATAARTIRTAQRLEEAAARYAFNEVPYGSLRLEDGAEELDDLDIEALLAAWEAARRRRATAYLPTGIRYDPVTGPNPEQLQLSEARQYIASEVARHLNLPPRYVGASAGDSMTYNSQAADRRDLVDLGLRPIITAVQSVLSMGHVTPRGQEVRLDASDFIASDPKDQADVFNSYIASGVTDTEEVRAWLKLPPRTPSSLPSQSSASALRRVIRLGSSAGPSHSASPPSPPWTAPATDSPGRPATTPSALSLSVSTTTRRLSAKLPRWR
jgi:HK97 family phage portal protein